MRNRREFLCMAGGAAFTAARCRAACYSSFLLPFQLPSSLSRTTNRTLPAREVVERRSWTSWSPDDWADLAAAYGALAVKRPGEQTCRLDLQAKLHSYACMNLNVHNSWAFLPWHRGFLYFHERILGTVSKKYGHKFRLPIWDWEITRKKIPQPWGTLIAYNSVVNASPHFAQLNFGPRAGIDPCTIQAWLFSPDLTTFVGDEKGSITPRSFGSVHLNVHLSACGAMSNFSTAAADPLFYGHHGNIDRFWNYWESQFPEYRTESQALSNRFWDSQSFTYYDENNNPVTIQARQLEKISCLGYSYPAIDPKYGGLNRLDLLPLGTDAAKFATQDFTRLATAVLSWIPADRRIGFYKAFSATSFSQMVTRLASVFSGMAPTVTRFGDVLQEQDIHVSIPLQLTLTVPKDPKTGKPAIEPGRYYGVKIAAAATDKGVQIGGFGYLPSHDPEAPKTVFVSCCLCSDALNVIWQSPNQFSLYYGIVDSNGSLTAPFIPVARWEWSVLFPKAGATEACRGLERALGGRSSACPAF